MTSAFKSIGETALPASDTAKPRKTGNLNLTEKFLSIFKKFSTTKNIRNNSSGLTTHGPGEEGGGYAIPKPTDEIRGWDPVRDLKQPEITTHALGEEGGGYVKPKPTDEIRGWDPIRDVYQPEIIATTQAMGEEGGGNEKPRDEKPLPVITMAIGEDGRG